jgi:hypothetical protein
MSAQHFAIESPEFHADCKKLAGRKRDFMGTNPAANFKLVKSLE